tara:strand:+ start:694 stop:954 length:261 start_codon:yes stop_codon:yes gene_type:complete
MKKLKLIAFMAFFAVFFYFTGILLEDHPEWNSAIPYVFIFILYMRYETKIENMSMDLMAVEEHLEEVSKGEWKVSMRFRGNPYQPN